jgi:hypothetical protein
MRQAMSCVLLLGRCQCARLRAGERKRAELDQHEHGMAADQSAINFAAEVQQARVVADGGGLAFASL